MFKGALWSFLVNKQKLFIFSLTYNNAMGVSLRSNKSVKCIFLLADFKKIF